MNFILFVLETQRKTFSKYIILISVHKMLKFNSHYTHFC